MRSTIGQTVTMRTGCRTLGDHLKITTTCRIGAPVSTMRTRGSSARTKWNASTVTHSLRYCLTRSRIRCTSARTEPVLTSLAARRRKKSVLTITPKKKGTCTRRSLLRVFRVGCRLMTAWSGTRSKCTSISLCESRPSHRRPRTLGTRKTETSNPRVSKTSTSSKSSSYSKKSPKHAGPLFRTTSRSKVNLTTKRSQSPKTQRKTKRSLVPTRRR